MRSPTRWPLRFQILLPFTLVLLVAIVSVSVLNAVFATQRARQQIESQLQGIAATLDRSSFPLTDVVLRQMHGLSQAEFVFTDRQGQALASTGAVELRQENPIAVSRWQELRLGPPVDVNGQRYFAMVLALDRRGLQPAGMLHIFYPEQSWRQARNEAIFPPLLVGGIALAATALVALLLAGRLTRPILELRSQVNRIARADYAPMPLPPRNDELRDLAVSVNRLAEQLTEMDSAIRRSERWSLLGQLAGGLAHHLRNNVTGAMAVQLHERECEHDRESLTVALRQLTLLEENLKQLLASPQSLEQTAVRSEVQIGDVIQEVVELVSPSLQHRRVALSVNSSIDVGAASHHTLQADAGQLRQLLVNLVLNGADAAGPGGWVKVSTDSATVANGDSPQIVLCVTDSGPGPAREMAARMFEPFFTTKPEGIGLGLAVSKQIVESHGGSIYFSREIGETCIEVHLPMAHTAANGLSPINSPSNPVSQPCPTS